MTQLRRPPRRLVRRGAVLLATVAVLGVVAVPSFAASASSPTPAQLTTAVVKHLPAWGTYAVVVSLAKPKVQESASVSVGALVQNNVVVAPWQGAQAAFYVHVKAKTVTVKVVGSATPIKFSVALARQTTPPPSHPSAGTYLNAPSNPYNNLVWSDEFNGPANSAPNSANWTADTGGGCGVDTLSTNTTDPANASLDGAGSLAITALPVPGQPGAYTSAQLDSGGKFSFTYGRIEARIQVPVGLGLCSAFWMVGDSVSNTATCWPNCGEIDVMEQIGQLPSEAFATLHGPIAATPGDGNNQQWQSNVIATAPLAGTWHTYGLIWSPGKLVWTLDGVPYAKATPASLPSGATWVFDGHPFHINLDLAVGGWPGAPSAATQFPATMHVAWVRVYQ
jgi:beta-glucanase (GH16 family)